MTNETKRDLHADLAICNAATAHVNNDTRLRYDWNGDEFVVTTWDGIELAMDISDECFARFIAEARTGWPHAIERAIEAERRVAELETALKITKEWHEYEKRRALAAEAEVERLRAALRTIARIPSTDPAAYKRIALNALKEKEATADDQR
jgi:hypothetical protein